MKARQDNRLLRSGYTTGACAAAAAQAATIALLKQEVVSQVQINLPDGNQAGFKVSQCVFDGSRAFCSVIKDAGDDPDVTHGAEIQATVSWKDRPGVTITGGKGVGVVTKPGLQIPVGMAAINPVPRQMIEHSVKKVGRNGLAGKGIEVTISVLGGEKLARKTLNALVVTVSCTSRRATTCSAILYAGKPDEAGSSQSL